ncbi:hypothetical protein PG987_015667 [Apiospora arundinis]
MPLLLITAVDVMDTVAVTDTMPLETDPVPIDPVAGYEEEDEFMNGGREPVGIVSVHVVVPPDTGTDMDALMLPEPVGIVTLSDSPQLPEAEGLEPPETEYVEKGGTDPEFG